MTRVLIIDNYDSFVYNIAQYLGELGAEVVVERNDSPALETTSSVPPTDMSSRRDRAIPGMRTGAWT